MSILTGKTNPVDSIPKFNDTSTNWLEWHKILVDNFGKKEANQLWLKAWGIRGSTSISDNTLRDYMKKQGVNLPATWGQKIEDSGVGLVDSALSVFHMGRTAGIIVFAVIVIPVGLLLINVARKPESVGTIIKAAAV